MRKRKNRILSPTAKIYSDASDFKIKPKSSSTLSKIAEAFDNLRKIALGVVTVTAATLALAIVIQSIATPVFIIEPIRIPKDLSDQGYTGEGLAARLKSEINDIWQNAKTTREFKYTLPLSKDVAAIMSERLAVESAKPGYHEYTQPKYDVAVGGISLAAIVSYIRDLFGLGGVVITGEIIGGRHSIGTELTNSIKLHTFSMNLRVSGFGFVYRERNGNESIDDLFHHAALNLMEHVQPYVVGIYYENHNQLEDAGRMVTKCLETDPNDPWAMNLRGSLAINLKEFDAAIAEFKNIIALFPHFTPAYYNLARVYLFQRNYDAAFEAATTGLQYENNPMRLAIGYNNAGVALLRLEKNEKAAEYFHFSIEADKHQPAAYLNLAEALERNEAPELVGKAYETAATKYPNPAHVYRRWGRYLVKIKRNGDAIKILERAVASEPRSAEGHNLLGLAQLNALHFGNAEEQFRLAIMYNKLVAPYYYNLGRTLRKRGNLNEAIEQFKIATETDSSHAWSFAQWGGTLVDKFLKPANSDPALKKSAIEKLEIAVITAPDNSRVRREVGLAYELLNMPQAAIENFEVAVAAEEGANGDLQRRIEDLRSVLAKRY
jgi:tetratricopeptide (TPR) repeat protein